MARSKTTYTSDQRIGLVLRPEQKLWLKQKAGPLRGMSDVLRDLIDEAMKHS